MTDNIKDTIEVRFITSDKTVSCEVGTQISALLENFNVLDKPLAAVYANNEALPLSARLEVNTALAPLYLDTHEGQSIYRQTLAFVLAAAARAVFPDRKLYIGHSLGYSFYYSFIGDDRCTREKTQELEKEMRHIVKKDMPINFRYMAHEEARLFFEKNGQADTALLLDQRNESKVPVNKCGSFIDIHNSALLHRTGLLSVFRLEPYQDGFLLRFPATGEGGRLREFKDEPKIFSVYHEYKQWGRVAGVHAAGHLNRVIAGGNIREFIRVAEAYHSKKLSEAADKIYERRDSVKVILIAGPSSSGKTTTAKRLAVSLKVLGIEPIPVSLDDYYLHPDLVPKDEHGKPDLECLEALDVPYLNEQLLALLEGKEVTLPSYDFKTLTRREGKRISLGRRNMLMLEGIHGLNDRLTAQIESGSKWKLYVSALTQLNIDDHNRISTSDNRLLRRIVRDSRFRGASAERSIGMWPSVHAGGQKHIFPYQNDADAVFNSALDYELSVLKFYAEPLLRSVKPVCPEYAEAIRLLSFLENFTPLPPQYVPSISILREFIGDSEFKY